MELRQWRERVDFATTNTIVYPSSQEMQALGPWDRASEKSLPTCEPHSGRQENHKLLLDKCPTAVRNRPGRSLAFATHGCREAIDWIDVHTLELIGKCQQHKSFSQPRSKSALDAIPQICCGYKELLVKLRPTRCAVSILFQLLCPSAPVAD